MMFELRRLSDDVTSRDGITMQDAVSRLNLSAPDPQAHAKPPTVADCGGARRFRAAPIEAITAGQV